MYDPKFTHDHLMECQETRALLKDKFPGAWLDEPDRVEWNHAGLNCMAIRHSRHFHWCGYVGLPPHHPDYGKDYDDVDVDVHGGLTYGEKCVGHVCHQPLTGEPDELFWFGFDCAHWSDLQPGMVAILKDLSMPMLTDFNLERFSTYRDIDFVKRETNQLAEHFAKSLAK